MLGPYGKLNLYLVSLGLMPAALITKGTRGLPNPFSIQARSTIINGVEDEFKERKVKYKFNSRLDGEIRRLPETSIQKCQYRVFGWHIGNTQAKLRDLVDARGVIEIYMTTGVPDSCIVAFYEGNTMDRIFKQLWKAQDAGLEIPQWFGYINHVPTNMDLVKGEICEDSRKLGESYRDALRKENPQFFSEFENLSKNYILEALAGYRKYSSSL